MKEIKFKAKRKDNGEWYFGSLIKTENIFNSNKYYYYIEDEYGDRFEVIPETICQYLGSINDVDLYENDIIKGFEDMYDNEVKGKVVLSLENGLQLHCKDKIYHFDYIYDFELIGNVYDKENTNANTTN